MTEHDPAALQFLDRAASLLYLPVNDGLHDLTAGFRYQFDSTQELRDECVGRLLWRTPLRFRVEFETPLTSDGQRKAKGLLENVVGVLERPHPLRSLQRRPRGARIVHTAEHEIRVIADPATPPLPRVAPSGAHNVWKRRTESRLCFDEVGLLREAVTKGEFWESPSGSGEQRSSFMYEGCGSLHAVRSFEMSLSWPPMRFRIEVSYLRVGGFLVPSRITSTLVPAMFENVKLVDDVALSNHAPNTGIGVEGLDPIADDEGETGAGS